MERRASRSSVISLLPLASRHTPCARSERTAWSPDPPGEGWPRPEPMPDDLIGINFTGEAPSRGDDRVRGGIGAFRRESGIIVERNMVAAREPAVDVGARALTWVGAIPFANI